ncbi:uncharacterized protein K444DRAFT_630329 [Hyaloscypha bicolor E]|uniref:2EXR domain-containing protein n=1 Tax=Hyaloscypha bicolor E TaxID=1095630 RepID=A0A2J6T6H5_9HELO|nr:uncharacterized protein K444DRAFT_630329 [Hyaloscypha bicolor E]PMD58614.1 hypothetical protein K444DRAFT_630329 [Hyaloscypha bicolor E]
MSPQTFFLFSLLPQEIRYQIYTLATASRVLPIYDKPSRTHAHAIPPPLLHTCQDSRLFLISSGYRLAFSSPTEPKQEPQWYNPSLDTVLVVDPGYYPPRPWLHTRFLDKDARSVRGLGVPGSCSAELVPTDQLWRRVLEVLRFFGRVEEVQLVETMEFATSWQGLETSAGVFTSFRGVQVDWVEVGIEEARGWWNGDECGVVCGRYCRAVGEWVRDGGDEMVYFRELYGRAEKMLESVGGGEKQEGRWVVPRVKSVHVMSEWGRRRLERYREKFWEARGEGGMRDVERDRPLSPCTVVFADDIEVFEDPWSGL